MTIFFSRNKIIVGECYSPPNTPQIIVETVRIQPNPVILAASKVTKTEYWDTNCSDSTKQISYEDAQLLMKVAQAEAGNQGKEGMVLVLTVILNRTADDAFPDTIKGVIYQKGAFETVSNGAINKVELTPEVHEALAEVEKGITDTRIIAFEASANGRTLERYFTYLYTYGGHDFYGIKKNP